MASENYCLIHGPKGTSRGFIRKTTTLGQLSFSGSTIPGMSGSVYHIDGKVVGMHTGYLEKTINVGVAASLIREELKHLSYVRVESSPELADNAYPDRETNWTEVQLAGHIEDTYSRKQATQRALQGEYDRIDNQRALRDFLQTQTQNKNAFRRVDYDDWNDSESGDESAFPRRKVIRTKKIKPHGPNEEEVNVPVVDMEVFERIRELEKKVARLANVSERIARLERRFEDMTGLGKPLRAAFTCDECEISCVTEEKLRNHKQSAHVVKEKFECDVCGQVCKTSNRLANHKENHRVKKWSCVFCNYQTENKKSLVDHITLHTLESENDAKVPFLERRKKLLTSSSPGSKDVVASQPRLLDPRKNRSRTVRFRENTVKSLRKQPEDLAGPSGESKQN